MAGTGELDYPYEASDEASETELLDRSLSVWKGWSKQNEDFAPIPLDLHTAASIGQYDCVRCKIQRGDEDLNKKNKGGWTAIMYACYIGHDTIVNLLLEAGVSVNVKNHKGQTPLMLAASCGNESVAYFLLNHKQGAELEARDSKGWSALFHATYSGHQDMVKFLLESGADCEAKEPHRMFTPFMEAAAAGHEIIVQYFLQHGINIVAKSCTGDTARSLALMNGHTKIVSLIENYGQSHILNRVEPALTLDGDLSSSDEAFQNPRRQSPRNSRSKSKGLSIREGPEAMNRLMYQAKQTTPQRAQLPKQNTIVPKGYVTFPTASAEQPEGSSGEIRSRDVTSPINQEDHRPLDSLRGRGTESSHEPEEEGGNAFSSTGALTIKSSSSSSGGLVAALGLSRENSVESMESMEDAGSEPLHQPVTTSARTLQGPARSKSHTSRSKPRRPQNREARNDRDTSSSGSSTTVTFSQEQQILGPTYSIPNYTSSYSPASSASAPKPRGPPPGFPAAPNPHNLPPVEQQKNLPPVAPEIQRDQPSAADHPTHPVPVAGPRQSPPKAEGGGGETGAAAHKELTPEVRREQGGVLASRPGDLPALLAQLGLMKYLTTFDEQDVDLQVFLSLTDNDLKEIGIKLFGPRRKMTNAIARWHSNVQIDIIGLEHAYADKLEAEMQELAIQLHQTSERNESLKQQVLQEKELRSVTEGCLMEDRAAWQKVSRLSADTRQRCDDLHKLNHSIRLYQDELARRFGADKQGQLTGSDGQDSLAAALQEGLSLSDKFRDIPPEISKLPTQAIVRQIRKWTEEVEGIIALVTVSADKLLGREVKFDIQLPGYS